MNKITQNNTNTSVSNFTNKVWEKVIQPAINGNNVLWRTYGGNYIDPVISSIAKSNKLPKNHILISLNPQYLDNPEYLEIRNALEYVQVHGKNKLSEDVLTYVTQTLEQSPKDTKLEVSLLTNVLLRLVKNYGLSVTMVMENPEYIQKYKELLDLPVTFVFISYTETLDTKLLPVDKNYIVMDRELVPTKEVWEGIAQAIRPYRGADIPSTLINKAYEKASLFPNLFSYMLRTQIKGDTLSGEIPVKYVEHTLKKLLSSLHKQTQEYLKGESPKPYSNYIFEVGIDSQQVHKIRNLMSYLTMELA